MCGIFGFFATPKANLSRVELTTTIRCLFKLSESRGKESVGLHFYLPKLSKSWTLKAPQSASTLLRSGQYKDFISSSLGAAFEQDAIPTCSIALLAHSRLVTNGSAALPVNNQPVRSNGTVLIHNGIVTNVDKLWAAKSHLRRIAEVDTEIIAAMLSSAIQEGTAPVRATAQVFSELEGSASIAWVREGEDWAILASNTGDLYYYIDTQSGYAFFASERYILSQALKSSFAEKNQPQDIRWLKPGSGCRIQLDNMDVRLFDMADENSMFESTDTLHDRAAPVTHSEVPVSSPRQTIAHRYSADYSLLRYNASRLAELKRCSRCVLPETFPFISFNAQGVCNYCEGYRPRYRGVDAQAAKKNFLTKIEQYRGRNGTPDVLVPFSGGRDSSYGLHIIKNEFGFTPITFTYDWGMVTDLARRNVARMCGQLGVQNILVSANIRQKRDNIRKNVSAWLKQPDLGMVPLFMAGDKHFFSIVNRLKRQTSIRLDLWSANPLENTDFKSGFCGIRPDFEKERLDYLSIGRKARMALYYGKRFVRNPAYLNSSLLDTAAAFFSYYFEPRRDFYFMFNDMIWNERDVNDVLLRHYNWELATDTKSTWRIGDGTAPFYNYIYTTAYGFSEFDTFRSNQIREGMLSRSEAIEEVYIENQPRPESIKWYLDAIGLPFDPTIRKINELDRMGLHLG